MLYSRAELFRVHGECRALRIIEELRLCYILRAELFRVHGECRALRIIEELRLCYILGLSCSGFMENAEL